MTCELCGTELHIGDFPFCKGDPTQHGRGYTSVKGDECDFVQENGLKHPRRFTSRIEFKKWLKDNHYENKVCNAGVHDTIVKSWSSMDAYTLEAARVLTTRNGGSKGKDASAEAPLNVTWTSGDWDGTFR